MNLSRRDLIAFGIAGATLPQLAGLAASAETPETPARPSPPPEYTVIAEGLRFPEGPVVMPDGSLVVTEIEAGRLTRIWGDGKTETVATTGGGPNDAKLGPDGALYVCNNGGFEFYEADGLLVPGHIAKDYSGGRIERVAPDTGEITRLFDTVGEHKLKGPNSLVFDKTGQFYFTDHGKTYERQRDLTGLYKANADGTGARELDFGHVSLNGVGLSPDERTLYVADTLTGRLWAYDLDEAGDIVPAMPPFQKGRVVASMPGWTLFDSLAVTAAGNVCVATLINGGITTITPDGDTSHTPLPDLLTTNLAFGGADRRDAYVCLSGTGKVIRMRWPEAGLKLNFGA